MRNKNKLGLVLLALALPVMLFAGCGAKEKQPEEVKLSDCTIVYDRSDYMSKRYAYRLHSEIKLLTGDTLECVTVDKADQVTTKIVVTEVDGFDGAASAGNAKISVDGGTITCQVDSYYGFEAVLDYFRSNCEKDTEYVLADGFNWEGSYLDTLEESEASDAYAYERVGEYRVMFYNVLWYSPGSAANDKPGERNVLQTEMISQYLPDVIGLQECNGTKREEAKEQNIVTLLEEAGYAEVEVTADNPLQVNCTPIFYKTDSMIPVTGGYLNYKNQPYEETDQNKSSKSLTWCLFETAEGEKLIVVSTHMETRDSAVRFNQAEEAVKLINTLVEQYNAPVILGGDFNTTDGTSTFRHYTQTAGYKDVLRNATEFSADIRTNHAYPSYKIVKDMIDFNGMHGRSGEIITKDLGLSIDHILLTNESSIELNVYGVVVDDCTKAASDHFPTFIDFSLKN